jgi:hypothetical protein
VINFYISNNQVFEIHKDADGVFTYLINNYTSYGWIPEQLFVQYESLDTIKIDGKRLIDMLAEGSVTNIEQISSGNS